MHAQNKPFEGVTATNLENIRYPFPSHFITLDIQGEQLEMEYMGVVHPDKPIGYAFHTHVSGTGIPGMIFTQPVCYEFQHIKLPTLLIIGQRDRTALTKDKAPEAVN